MGKDLPAPSTGGFFAGAALPLRGLRFLLANGGVKRYAALPLLLNILLYALALALLFWLLGRWEIGAVAWDFWGPAGRWLSAAVNWAGWIVKAAAGLAALAIAYFSFTAVGMILASPLNDLLSEKIEAVYTGTAKSPDLPFRLTARASLLSVWDSIATACKQLVYSVFSLPFLLVPVIGFAPLFLVGAYFSGFGFIDSAMARNYLRPKHKKLLAKGNIRKIVGFGAVMQILFFVPFVGLLLMPLGVAAGTLLYCDCDWNKLFHENGVNSPRGFQVPTKQGAEEPKSP
ncbi:MAG: EI24 domain-containing protein [Planctomycetota bacterium]|jgi:CysZ protein|nr:EI24 domain-containing protein [Planctomycetota bacterium]